MKLSTNSLEHILLKTGQRVGTAIAVEDECDGDLLIGYDIT